MDTSEVLRKARDHIAKPGMWWKGGDYFQGFPGYDLSDLESQPDGPCCMYGAVFWAAEDEDFAKLADSYLRKACGRVVEFNDRPSTTLDDMLAAFDRAIELAGAEE